MRQLYRLLNGLILATVLILLFTGCYYDIEEELYPDTGICDTSGITYTNSIAPLLSANCIACHSGAAPSGSVNLSTYEFVKAYALDGSLYGSMSHDPNWSAMPQGGNKTDDCSLLKVQTWINNGMPN